MLRRWLIVLLVMLGLGGCGMVSKIKNQQGALQVTSNGAFRVYLDETFLGQTPFFDEKIKAGNYILRLVPSDDASEGVWQHQIQIAQRALTVVHYEWGGESETSSSDVLELEPLINDEAVELTLTTMPDNVVVKLDGVLQGFSPVVFDEIVEGDHVLALEAPGYKSKTINLKTNKGYRLKVTAQLARDPKLMLDAIEEAPLPATGGAVPDEKKQEERENESLNKPKVSPTPTASPTQKASSGFGDVIGGITVGESSTSQLDKPYVQILETGVGWLRVRAEPNGLRNNEIAKVKVGDYFPFEDYSENNEWVKIEYSEGKSGWVSAQYVKVVK